MSAWTEPSTSFASETINGPATGPAYSVIVFGDTVNHERVMNSHAAQVIPTSTGASDGGISVHLYGSFDGTNFYQITGSADSNQLLQAENVPAQFVRAGASVLTLYGGQAVFTLTVLVVAQEAE